MSSRMMMIRSCSSSIRTLLRRHLRPTVAATNVQTETPASIYNLQYLLPNSIVPRTVNLRDEFSVGYSISLEDARAQRMIDPSKEYEFEEDSDGSELDENVFEDFDDDDDDEDDEDDDDDVPSSGR